MTKPNMLKLAAWKSRKNPEYREALQQLLKDARTEYRQRRLLEACGINTISPIEQRWAKMIPGCRVWGAAQYRAPDGLWNSSRRL